MNTKKIWLWSIILGMMVALVAYFTFLPKQSASTGPSVEAAEDVKTEAEENAVGQEEEPNFNRKIINPIVDVSTGKRAVSIYVDLVPGLSGYIQPESRVDVIAYEQTKDEKKKKEYKSAVLVLENLKVLAAGKSVDTETEALQYQTITLEVTPEEGVMLGLASKDKDGFYLMLRNNEDTETGKKGYKETREVIKEDGEEEEK
jgi:pilus assembly protein CpaB